MSKSCDTFAIQQSQKVHAPKIRERIHYTLKSK